MSSARRQQNRCIAIFNSRKDRTQMVKIAVLPNLTKDPDLAFTKSILPLLAGRCELMMPDTLPIEGVTPVPEAELYKACDLMLVLGGDGTILGYARAAARYEKPMLGINLGHLGFMAELEKTSFHQALADKLLQGEYTVERRMMLDVSVYKSDRLADQFVALNDAVISGLSRAVAISEYVDNQFVDTFRADGVIVATPTGSTAYSLSAGGPVCSPDAALMLMTPICPHTIHSRCVVVSAESEIKIVVTDCRESVSTSLTVDGQESVNLDTGDYVIIRKSPYTTRLIQLTDTNFYKLLRYKLSGRL